MFQKEKAKIESLERALEALKKDNERLEREWQKEQIDLSEIKEQVLRNLNRLVTRQRTEKKTQEREPELPAAAESDNHREINPLAASILKGRV